jgi:hypothetical protein
MRAAARRPAVRGAALVAALVAACAATAAAQPVVRGRAAPSRVAWSVGDSSDADAIVRVVVENGPQLTLMALGRDTTLLLPVRQLFSILEVAITDDEPERRLVGLVDPNRPPAGFDTERGMLLGGNAAEPLPPGTVTWQQGELYAPAALIARALRVRVEVDQSTLTVTFLSVRDLPVLRRLDRQRQRAAQWRAGGAPPPSVPVIDRPAVLDGLQLDWAFLSPIDNPLNVTSARLGLGAQLLGGGLEVQQQQLGTGAFLNGQTTWSWLRAWQDGQWLRQAGLGSVAVPGRRGRTVDGVMLTNVPYFRPADYASAWLDGALPTGWELEVQRYGLPLATVRPDASGSWRYEVPVSYGPNELELVAYGPGGQSRRWRANVVVPFERLPAGRLEYVAAAGACHFDLCQRAASVDVRYGLSDRLTVQGGLSQYAMPGGRGISNPFVLASYAVRRHLNVLAEVVGNGYTRGEVDFQPTTDFRVTASAAAYDTSFGSLFVNRSRARSRLEGRVFWRPVEEQRGFWFALEGSQEEQGAVSTQAERLLASWLRGPLRLQGGLLLDRTQLAGATTSFARTRTELTLESSMLSPWAVTRGLYGRATTLFDADGSLSQFSASLFNAVSRRYRFEAGVQWVRGLSAPVVTLQVQSNLPSVQAVSTVQQAGGTVVGGQSFAGTASFDPRSRRVLVGNDLANGRGVGYGALDLEAFVDANGNGVRDPGEAAVAGLRAVVGAQTIVTDRDGQALVRTLNAFVPSYVEVDTSSLANPMWIVEQPVVGVVVRPNSSTRLAIPVRPAGGIVGRLEFADGSQGPTGAEVELVHLASREARRAVTYGDGSFEAFKLRPGTWEVRPTNATLLRARARADVMTVDVNASNDDGFVETVTLTLLPTAVTPAPVRYPTVPALPAWAPDTLRRLDLPVPARPRRTALEAAAPAAPPARVAPRVAPRLAPRDFGPDARPRARVLPPRAGGPEARPATPRAFPPDARPSAPRPRPGAAPRPATPRAFPPDARPSAPRARPARPLAPDARDAAPRARATPTPRAPSLAPRPAAPRAATPRPAAPRGASPDARPRPAAPRAVTPRAPTPAPRAVTPRKAPPRSGGGVRPEE